MDSKRETLELLSEYTRAPTPRLRNRIATLNLGLVRKVAHAKSKDGRETFEDLHQVGVIGLLKAIEKFDITQGRAFSSLAMPYIGGEISHWLRDRGHLLKPPRVWWDKYPKIRKLLDADATLAEIAAETGIPLGDLPQAICAMQRPDPASTDRPLGDDGDTYDPPAPADIHFYWENDLAMDITRRADGLIDATAICASHKKRFTDYWRRRGQRYQSTLGGKKKRCQTVTFSEITQGRNGRAWVCDAIAVDLLRWCDPAMGAKLDEIVVQRITA